MASRVPRAQSLATSRPGSSYSLRDLGDSGKPREVFDRIAKTQGLPDEFLDETLKFGCSESELAAKEVEFIRALRSNDPAVGYNRWPKLSA